MIILVLNNWNNILFDECIRQGATLLDIKAGNFHQTLNKTALERSNDMLIIDSELKLNNNSHYLDFEGLKIAYNLRINPVCKFKGFIKICGFLPSKLVLNNRYAKLIATEGTQYYRYPHIDISEGKPLNMDAWENVAVSLDQSLIDEFRHFEHGLKNITIHSLDNLNEKKEELLSFFNQLIEMENKSQIPLNLIKDYQKLKVNFKSVITNIFDTNVSKNLAKLKKDALDLKIKFMDKI